MKCTKMDRKKLEPSHPVLHMYKLTKTASGQVNYVCVNWVILVMSVAS
jgi:hypothetical protein